ncbi:NADH-ubiquinone/plastoquinone oxidoreductase chain 6 [Solidesulfovibrio carbinoliphilus subsp. oakridgensis]|uniref:NADH-quinone oxidoreductase subunit J n=1 Tax=Solidesulfovibrio carbinoliphilus subsp. oakridgensis TaxID=694327 RepID=G7QCX9_9BACT|nr:NADH-quinone oxidoreductase subunit J [Solidesulfovibrio carbinoliphilus]EHJ46285.1 NADH-ubiquinone/plastoquinone oxidoreductase chain 6 [Solidesulfovibrio carbinoliphilus subsp. oakridgensis]
MTALGALFYLLAAVLLGAAVLTATRRNPMHAVCCAVITFLAAAGMFVVLGAPLPGVLEVVVYAGAIMVLFLFIIMLLGLSAGTGPVRAGRLVVPGVLAAASLVALFALIGADPAGRTMLPAAIASPAAVGTVLFDAYWLAVEVVSLLLFAALAAALLFGRAPKARTTGGHAA